MMIRLITTTRTPVNMIRLEYRKYSNCVIGYHWGDSKGLYMLMKRRAKTEVKTTNRVRLDLL
jgi:hypothetical protein